jgi:hypothetical protein
MWPRAYEGYPRHRRVGHAAAGRPGESRGHDGRRRLHQDVDRQGAGKRHPPGRGRDDTCHSRVSRAHRTPRRLQTGRRHSHREVGARVGDPHERGARRRVAAAVAIPSWRLRAPDRHRTTALAFHLGPVRRGVPPPHATKLAVRNEPIFRPTRRPRGGEEPSCR